MSATTTQETQTAHDTPWLLTVAEIALISRKGEQSVRWAIRQGQLTASKPTERGQYLASRAAVAAWLGLPVEDIRSRCSDGSAGQAAA